MTAEEWVAERIRQLVDAAPPLPKESLEVIRRLMRPTPELIEKASRERAA